MSCVLEVYGVCRQRGMEGIVTVHTNLGYTHFDTDRGIPGLLKCMGWQVYPIVWGNLSKSKRGRFDSWLRDGPPECIKAKEEPLPTGRQALRREPRPSLRQERPL